MLRAASTGRMVSLGSTGTQRSKLSIKKRQSSSFVGELDVGQPDVCASVLCVLSALSKKPFALCCSLCLVDKAVNALVSMFCRPPRRGRFGQTWPPQRCLARPCWLVCWTPCMSTSQAGRCNCCKSGIAATAAAVAMGRVPKEWDGRRLLAICGFSDRQ